MWGAEAFVRAGRSGNAARDSKCLTTCSLIKGGGRMVSARMDSVHQDQLSVHFQDDMKRAVDLMARELNHHPTVFMRME